MKLLKSATIPFCILLGIFLLVFFVAQPSHFTLFNPKGLIAEKETHLIVTFLLLMLCVGIPAVALTFFTAWKFRSTNPKAIYNPNGKHNLVWEVLWWLLPTAIVLILATLTWQSAHAIDPFKPIQSNVKPITIQVVALQWKWLFIYPEQHIATINYIAFPVNTPVNFQLTADAPMNSFWIPSLGGQMYAMAGMVNQLHLLATQPGEFAGSDAEISGKGFAGMRFTAKATSQSDFDKWVLTAKKSKTVLSRDLYGQLSKPSEDTPVTFYSSVDKDLYNLIVMKDMKPKISDDDDH